MKTMIAALGVLVLIGVQPASASVDRSTEGHGVTTAASTAPSSGQPIRLAAFYYTG